jgi:hypothetical protein
MLLYIVHGVSEEAPCHLRGDDLASLIELVIACVVKGFGNTSISEERFDCRESLLNRIIVWQVGREIFDETACNMFLQA